MQVISENIEFAMARHAPPKLPNDVDSIDVVGGPYLKSGAQIISGFMPAKLLIPNNFEIPYFDPRTKRGYQRKPHDARINQLAGDLRRDRVDLPTAILLNVRSRDASRAATEGKLIISDLLRRGAVPSKFYVVDGQHRVLALQKLLIENEELWQDFMIPFVCMLGASEEEEMRQFHIVNSTAKSVRTDLALQLLRKRADQDPDFLEALQERGQEWQVEGQALVERLALESPIWRKRIRMANMEKADTTIPSASMVASLKPLFQSPFFGSLKQEDQLKVLEAYWGGIRDVLRPVFDDPTEYALQKGVGVIVMHVLLPHVIEIVRNSGSSVGDAEAFSRILKDALERLEGDDGEGNPVSGSTFWAAAPLGAAGSYSSSAGRRVLVAKIRQMLPSVAVE